MDNLASWRHLLSPKTCQADGAVRFAAGKAVRLNLAAHGKWLAARETAITARPRPEVRQALFLAGSRSARGTRLADSAGRHATSVPPGQSLATIHERCDMTPTSHETCIQACTECAGACDHCAAACLRENDVRAMAQCIALDMDCADLCRLCATLLTRESTHARQLCQACAEACQACGDECGRHAHEHCQACASACHRCAQACRQVATM